MQEALWLDEILDFVQDDAKNENKRCLKLKGFKKCYKCKPVDIYFNNFIALGMLPIISEAIIEI